MATIRIKHLLLAILPLVIISCSASPDAEQKNDESQEQLKIERDIVNERLKIAKTPEEFFELVNGYIEKVEEYIPETKEDPLPPKKNTGKESKFLSNSFSQSELLIYKQQNHRLEFNGCTVKYNNKEAPITSPQKLVEILGGEHIHRETNYLREVEHSYFWPTMGLKIAYEQTNDPQDASPIILIYFDADEGSEFTKPFIGTLLVQGVPIYKGKRVVDFIENSKFSFEDLSIGNYAYYLRYDCYDDEESVIEYQLGTTGIWYYKGGGHMMFKDRPDESNPNPIETLFIGKKAK